MTDPTPPAPERERTIPGARVDTKRHHPMCNDLCAECVTWRYIDTLQDRIVALVQSYEAKVEDFAAETRRATDNWHEANYWEGLSKAAEAKLAAAEAERDEAHDHCMACQVTGPYEQGYEHGTLSGAAAVGRFREKLAAAEAELAEFDETVEQVQALRAKLAAAEAVIVAAEVLVDMIYPADVFNGSSGDPGALAVVAVRDALATYRATDD